jgi:hypothetical protein
MPAKAAPPGTSARALEFTRLLGEADRGPGQGDFAADLGDGLALTCPISEM